VAQLEFAHTFAILLAACTIPCTVMAEMYLVEMEDDTDNVW